MFTSYSLTEGDEVYTSIEGEGLEKVPHLFITSEKLLEYPQVITGVYKIPILKEFYKDYNKLLHGQWSLLSFEAAEVLITNLKQPLRLIVFNAITKTLEGYYNHIRASSSKYSKTMAYEFAEILMEEEPNLEVLPKIYKNEYSKHSK